HGLVQLVVASIRNGQLVVARLQPFHAVGFQAVALDVLLGPFVTFRRRQHEISKVDRTVFSDVGVASENGK
ncbi:hypothetical protein KQ738_18110, partial [Listeria monocytogenes]|nr:hypothetical protein [Listeria monocytogenes]